MKKNLLRVIGNTAGSSPWFAGALSGVIALFWGLLGSGTALADGRISGEVNAGFARHLNSQQFFGTATKDLETGTGVNAAAFVQLTRINSPLRVSLGLSHNYLTGSETETSPTLGVQALFPAVRLALPGIFLSVGYTFLVWNKNWPVLQRDGWLRVYDAKAFWAEVGVEYGLSPEASLTATLNTLLINSNGVTSPLPAAALTAGIRIYFFPNRSGEGGPTPAEYFRDGWRYPFGLPKK